MKWYWGINSLHLRPCMKRLVTSSTETFPSSFITSYWRVPSCVSSNEAPIIIMNWGLRSCTRFPYTKACLNSVELMEKSVSKMMGLVSPLLIRSEGRLYNTYITCCSSNSLNLKIFSIQSLPLDFISFIFSILSPLKSMFGIPSALVEAAIRPKRISLCLPWDFAVLYLMGQHRYLSVMGQEKILTITWFHWSIQVLPPILRLSLMKDMLHMM